METADYKTVYRGGSGEIEEKKSRFIATIRPIGSEEEATEFIAEMKKKYWDARHNCSAFVLGRNQEMTRCSDDGEPSGTAGRPMLDVLLREGIHNAAVVVTRYFGGTLLGTGGLVRAYQRSVQEGLSDCVIIEKQNGRLLEITTDYNGMGKLQYLLGNSNIPLVDTGYGQNVEMKVVVPVEKCDSLQKDIMDATNGQAAMAWGDMVEFAQIEKEIKIFEKIEKMT